MLYRLGFWLGPSPADALEACHALNQHICATDHAWGILETPVPPVPRIRAFVEEALRRYPLDDPAGSIWKYPDVRECAAGQAFHANLTGAGAQHARDDLAELAAAMGINAFDMVQHRMLPDRSPGAYAGEQSPNPDVLPAYLAGEDPTDDGTAEGIDAEILAGERSRYSPRARVCDGPERARESLGLDRVTVPKRTKIIPRGADAPVRGFPF
jgi:hypothetical protein